MLSAHTSTLSALGSAIPNMWSATNAASGYAQLAGTLAGFVFVSLTITVTAPRGAGLSRHADSSVLLSTAFILLLISALMFVIVSGELSPYRATFLAAIAAPTLGMGALFLMSGSTWLLWEYQRSSEATKNFRQLSLLVFAVVAAFVVLVVADILQWAPERYGQWVRNWLWISLAITAIAAGILATGYLIVVRLLRTETVRDEGVRPPNSVERWTRAISRASMVLLLLSARIWVWFIESTSLLMDPEDREYVFASTHLTVTNWLLAAYFLVYSGIVLTIPWQRYGLSEVDP